MSFSVFEYNLKHPITDESIEYQRERMAQQSPNQLERVKEVLSNEVGYYMTNHSKYALAVALQDHRIEIERLREALGLILNANNLNYAQEIASKALSEQDASPCPTNTIK